MGEEIQVVPRGYLESGTVIVDGRRSAEVIHQSFFNHYVPSHATGFFNFAPHHAHARLKLGDGKSGRAGIL